MKILKKTGNYLGEQVKINKYISYILFVFGGIGLLYSLSFWLLSFFAFAIGGFFFKNYLNYSGGLEAEGLVTEHLKKLDNKYYLINDVKLPESY